MQGGAGVRRGDGHAHLRGGGGGRGRGKRCLGVLDGDVEVGRIKIGDGVSGLDLLVLLNVDRQHVAGDARADLEKVAVNLRVVGVLGEGGAPPDADRDNDKDDEDEDEDAALARRLLQLRLRGRVR